MLTETEINFLRKEILNDGVTRIFNQTILSVL